MPLQRTCYSSGPQKDYTLSLVPATRGEEAGKSTQGGRNLSELDVALIVLCLILVHLLQPVRTGITASPH